MKKKKFELSVLLFVCCLFANPCDTNIYFNIQYKNINLEMLRRILYSYITMSTQIKRSQASTISASWGIFFGFALSPQKKQSSQLLQIIVAKIKENIYRTDTVLVYNEHVKYVDHLSYTSFSNNFL